LKKQLFAILNFFLPVATSTIS